ncbi:nicotinate (nicotinamide) nucleotide adenylyltransferase [Treponema zioleckii]|uniref:nicotinate (nicotinamide) nucleotide adenylyltransferase n=1 Tax=Treponema zioleckii TaxID=331680 RepID=UPI00168B2E0A|nr:nicotinate (nicotinamide) nucleotide adenylyltransferase [Treponema zioleckii]
MKIAILGGSFNPIHIGHMVLADSVCTQLGYDRVLFVPTYKPPHKELSVNVSSDDRFGMVLAAVKNDERFGAESCEIDRGGVSYTWDTVCFVEDKYKRNLTGKIGVIIGEDLIADYHKWEHAEELAEKADLILACRPSEDADDPFSNRAIGEYAKKDDCVVTRETFPYPHKIVENPFLKISSTEIRRKIAEKGAWRYLVTDGVFEYIKRRNLYGFTE